MAVRALTNARASTIQFRYLWVTDAEGVKLFDVTDMRNPVAMPQATVPLADARRIYVARTYAYVAAKRDGLVILDVTKPLAPKLYQRVTLDGTLDDAEDVIVGSTNATLFAYVADGRNGLKVLQLTTPDSQPNFYGFRPAPKPELIAWARTKGAALSLSKGLDRDRGSMRRRPDGGFRTPRIATVQPGGDGKAVLDPRRVPEGVGHPDAAWVGGRPVA